MLSCCVLNYKTDHFLYNFDLQLLWEEKTPIWSTWVLFEGRGQIRVDHGMLKLVFCWHTCWKNVCSAAERACFTSPVCTQKFGSGHQGPGDRDNSCSASYFPRPHDWLTAWAPMLLETRWQVRSPAGLCVRIIAFGGSDLTQSLKFITVWQHRIFLSIAHL